MMGNTMPLADQVYILQSNVIKEVASQGSCVILGRCGDYVLRDRPNVLRTFVFAPIDIRVANAKVRPDAKDMPDRLWETHLCLNAAIGQDACAQLIVQAAKAMEAANQE